MLWEGGPVPGCADGLTLPGLVIVRSGKSTPYLLRHELVHVRQWRRYGLIGFSVRYSAAYVVWRLRRKDHAGAYRRIPMEIEADWVARRSLSTAVREELSEQIVL